MYYRIRLAEQDEVDSICDETNQKKFEIIGEIGKIEYDVDREAFYICFFKDLVTGERIEIYDFNNKLRKTNRGLTVADADDDFYFYKFYRNVPSSQVIEYLKALTKKDIEEYCRYLNMIREASTKKYDDLVEEDKQERLRQRGNKSKIKALQRQVRKGQGK